MKPKIATINGKFHKVIKADTSERIECEWWLDKGIHVVDMQGKVVLKTTAPNSTCSLNIKQLSQEHTSCELTQGQTRQHLSL